MREITRRDVRALVAPIVDRGSLVMANRVLAVIRRMLNYGVRNDWLDANPASLIDNPGLEVSRERVLNDDEIRRLWRLLSRQPTTAERGAPGRKRSAGTPDDPICPVAPPLAASIKIRMLTAQRGGEVIKMRWQDLDLETGWWTIPGEFAKNGRAHRVPLVPEAIALINAQRKTEEEKRQESAQGSLDEEPNDFIFVGTGASVRDRAKKAPSRISRVLQIDFRGHDLRRTAATKMAEAGVPRHHISAVLNHVEAGASVTRIYARYNYDAEKRLALETWTKSCDLSWRQQVLDKVAFRVAWLPMPVAREPESAGRATAPASAPYTRPGNARPTHGRSAPSSRTPLTTTAGRSLLHVVRPACDLSLPSIPDIVSR
ncbi:MAG TPA: tyrosine-type recombinase/integrase [Gemmatimonadaceae bacterium]|nr:tyrosine-type recombinase/integrase [Gemmatimonadaceae bacterium]